MPETVIRSASAHLRDLNAQGAAPAAAERTPREQVSLLDLGAEHLAERLRSIDPDSLTPREALQLLYELTKEAGE